MKHNYNTDFTGIDDVIKEVKRQIQRFAFECLDGGCNEDVTLQDKPISNDGHFNKKMIASIKAIS